MKWTAQEGNSYPVGRNPNKSYIRSREGLDAHLYLSAGGFDHLDETLSMRLSPCRTVHGRFPHAAACAGATLLLAITIISLADLRTNRIKQRPKHPAKRYSGK